MPPLFPLCALVALLARSALDAESAAAEPAATPAPIVVARPIEVRGEVVALDCYLRDGSRGEAGRGCALAALTHGGSLAIVEDDTGTLFPLAGDTPASDPSAAVRDLVAQHVEVTGRLYERARGRVLVPEQVHRLGGD